jgi:hypothetical protein
MAPKVTKKAPAKPKRTGAAMPPEPKPTLPVEEPVELPTDGAEEENVPLIEDAQMVWGALAVVVKDVQAGVTKEEIPAFDALRQGLDKASKALKEATREDAIAAAKGAEGTFKCDTGQITYTFIPGTELVEYTEDTTNYLEGIGVLEEAVNLHARLRPGVDVKTISEEELAILQKYFDMEYEVDPDKMAALTTLGKVDADEVEKTVMRTPGKAQERVTITPKPEVKKVFSL